MSGNSGGIKENTMFRKIIITTLFIFIFFSGGVQAQLKIFDIRGKAIVGGDKAVRGTEIKQNQSINTTLGDTSYIDIELEGNKKIRWQNAQGSFESFRDSLEISLDRGELFYGSDTQAEDNLQINTTNAIAGIRGTKFYIKATSEQTYICVCAGEVYAYKPGFFNWLFGDEIIIEKDYDAHIFRDKKLPEPKYSPQMIDWTWKRLEQMGFERSD